MAGIINLRLRILGIMGIGLAALVLSACTAEAEVEPFPIHVDPDTGIEYVGVDRFSDDAGTILRRSDNPELPAPNKPIDYDADFLNHALGPDAEDVQYYGFDVASFRSATLYSFVYASDPTERVPGQSAVFDVIPGDDGYNDFWQMTTVLVPDDYEPDSVRSLANIEAAGYELKPTGLIINCTIVPYGSSVELASRESVGWYKDKHVAYFSFEATQTGIVSQSQLDVPHAVVRALLAPDANSYLQDDLA